MFTLDFSMATFNARRQWSYVYKLLKKKYDPKILHPARLNLIVNAADRNS